MLVQPDAADTAEIAGEGGAQLEVHLPHIAAHAGIVKLSQAGSDQRGVVLGRVVVLFPRVVALECIELGCSGFPFAAGLSLHVVLACENDAPISGTHVSHTQVQDLPAVGICPEVSRLRQAELAADSTVQCSNGVTRQADKW